MEESVRDRLVTELKRKALASKQAGDKNQALAYLKQYKVLEVAASLEDLDDSLKIMYLKTIALHHKKAGDMDEAMAALNKAKIIDEPSLQSETAEDDNLNEIEGEREGQITFTDEEMMDEDTMMEFQACGMDVPSQEAYQQRILVFKHKALACKKKNDVKAATAELFKAKQLQKVMKFLDTINSSLAIDSEEGMASAERWINNVTVEERELLGELFDDVNSNSARIDALHSDEGRKEDIQQITWQDLESLDESDVKEFLGIVELPSIQDLTKMAEDSQKEALQYKQNGNIEMAKIKLIDSKKIKLQGVRLECIYKEMNESSKSPDYSNFDDQEIERLLLGEGDTKNTRKEKPKISSNPWLQKTAAEIKEEVLRLKDEKKVTEAMEMVNHYKQILRKEREEKETANREEMVTMIQKEIELCQLQLQLYSFYIVFVDSTSSLGSSQQMILWKKYMARCHNAISIIEKKGSNAIVTSHVKVPNLIIIHNNENSIARMVEKGTIPNSLNGRLEVSILELLHLHENKNILKLLKKRQKESKDSEIDATLSDSAAFSELQQQLQVDVKVHLPPGDDASEMITKEDAPQSTTLTFLPLPSSTQKLDIQRLDCWCSKSPQYVALPRGESTRATQMIRRIARKRVEVHLIHNQNLTNIQKRKSSSWLWKSFPDESNGDVKRESTHLGKIVLELKELLSRNCMAAGDFPLVVNTKAVGGMIRLCIRTDAPLNKSRLEKIDDGVIRTQLYSNELSFLHVQD
jgi:hypothetical protein